MMNLNYLNANWFQTSSKVAVKVEKYYIKTIKLIGDCYDGISVFGENFCLLILVGCVWTMYVHWDYIFLLLLPP